MLPELEHWEDGIADSGVLIGIRENDGLSLRVTRDLSDTENPEFRILLIASPERGGAAVQVDRTYEGEATARDLLREWAARHNPLDVSDLELTIE